MIKPGLNRIQKLLKSLGRPDRKFDVIHVAGTNGKGSVCASLSNILKCASIHHGRFTSPCLLRNFDCIYINNSEVERRLFASVEQDVIRLNDELNIKASAFELLTAVAFKTFELKNVPLAVVEVGMGGAEDATNVFENPLASVLVKIGLDHQDFLGHTIEEITEHKCGIIKPRHPCILNSTNIDRVKAIVLQDCAQKGSNLILSSYTKPNGDKFVIDGLESWNNESISFPLNEQASFQIENLACAVNAAKILSDKGYHISTTSLINGLQSISWPGRLSLIELQGATGTLGILVDGAHNEDAAIQLAKYRKQRYGTKPLTWLLAFSNPSKIGPMASHLVLPQDSVGAVEFSPVDGMQWINSVSAKDVVSNIQESCHEIRGFGNHISDALQWAALLNQPTIATGSLYLYKDLINYAE